MKQKLLFAIFACCLFVQNTYSQTGYIYVHLKHVNEEASPNYSYTLKNSSGTTVKTFNLNDQPSADNTTSGSYVYVYDIGESHGTGGDGQLWVVGGTSWGSLQASNTLTALSGTIYYRNEGSSVWASAGISSARSIDGAYANQCVYTTTSGNVVFYNNGSTSTIYTGTDAWDVTANGGKIAITTTAGAIKVYANAYTTSAAPATGGTWNTVTSPNAITQLDMNLSGSKIVYLTYNTTTPKTVTAATSGTQTPTSLASFSSLASASGTWDIAYDDSDYVYFSATSSTAGITSIYSSTTTSATAWNYESRSGDVTGVTAGAARSVFAIQTQLTSPADETIFSRFTDQTGTVYWVDDDRVKSTSSVYGNGIMIAVSPGTYTLTETLPSSSYDLGRVNVYDPRGNTTYSVNTQTITYVVAQNVVVCGEYVNEKLNPKAIALTCSFQYLQTFDASNSSPLYGTTTFGSGTYGTNVEGTSYHYWNQATAHDGYYFLIKNETGSQWFTNDGIVDHTGNGGYFLLVNASFQVDEFYRQRVTNLVPGLSYSITFYAANASPSATTLYPNITFGLQDTSGAYLSPTTTGNITSATWTKYTLTFTATTSTADLFLSNNGIGGNGNDIAIDDIAINPVITPLPTITVTPVIAPNVCIGTTYTFGNSQSGGVWTTSPSTVATVINASTGKIKGIAAGNATVTYSYTNAIGCTSTTSTGIIVSPKPTVTTSDLLGGTSCLNQTDSLFSTVSSGTTPYTYAWTELSGTGTGGLGTSNIPNTIAAPTASGSYTYLMTVTDAVGCAGTSSVSLSVSANTAPTVTAGISSSPYCTSSAINLSSSATGGSGSYTYTWSASPTGNGLGTTNTQNTTATPTAAGTYAYKIVVNDGFCNVPKTVSATVNSTPSVTVSAPTGTQILCSNASYAITSTPSGGSGTYTYAWSASKVSGLDNGPGLQSPTNTQNVTAKPTLTLSTALVPDVYKYSLTITDGNGCTAAGSANVTAYLNALAAAPTVSISAPSSANTICLGSTVTLTGSASGGSTPYTYSWTGPNSYTAAVLSPGAITPSAAGTGTYTLTVTGNNGCKASATSPAITVNPAPSVVVSRFAAKLCANTVDSVYATASGGTAPYTYLWTSSSNSGGFNISQTTNDTTAVTGGNSGTAYTLTMTVTDAGPTTHCTATANTTITKSSSNGPSLSVTPSSNGTICINSATTLTGTASSGTSPYTYAWTATGSGNTFSAATAASTTVTPSVAGSYLYTLKVTDNNGCAIQKSTGTQTVNSPLVVTTTADAPGFCGANGSVNLVASPSGGSGTYSSYVWTTAVKVSPGSTTVSPTSSTTTGVTTATISGATVGTSRFQYFAVVTDNAGCTGSDSSDILVVGSTPTFSATPTATISSACVGQIFNLSSAAFSGGTPSYNYSWTAPTGVTVATASGTASSSPIPATTAPASVAGNYNFGLLVVDGNNCKVTASIAASTINPVPVITLASDDYSVCKAPATTINLTGTFTTATASPYTYAWTGSGVVNNTSSNVTTAVPTTSGTYGVTVTDGNGCTGNATSSTVTALSSPVITASADKTVACATPATTINLTGSLTTGTTSPYTYSWAGNGVIAANSLTTNATPTAAGSYTITVTDANGCTATGTTTNVSYDALIASVTFGNCGTNSAGVKYGQLSETNGSTWLWTTIDGGRFYKTNALSVTTDSAISHLQAPYVTFLGTYSVAITDGNNCTASGSVTVTSSSCSIILAVSNLSFSAQKQGNTVLLDWRTTTEINNDHFDVERSSDGINWQVIATVKGHGNSTTPIQYSYADALPLNGTNYYRLKQTDADGKYTYSTVKTVQFIGQWLVKLYPNPVKGFMVLEFNNDRDEKGAIVIQTMAGSTIFATEKQLVKGLNRITLNQVQPLVQGTYMVTLGTLNNVFRSKFVKAGN